MQVQCIFCLLLLFWLYWFLLVADCFILHEKRFSISYLAFQQHIFAVFSAKYVFFLRIFCCKLWNVQTCLYRVENWMLHQIDLEISLNMLRRLTYLKYWKCTSLCWSDGASKYLQENAVEKWIDHRHADINTGFSVLLSGQLIPQISKTISAHKLATARLWMSSSPP